MRRLLVAALVAVAFAAAAPSDAAPRGGVAQVGWWTKRPGAAERPAGGFEVATGVDGPYSVAAVRLAPTDDGAKVELVLHESGGVGSSAASLRACRTGDRWKAANPGPYAEAPKARCSTFAPFVREDTTWIADVTALVGDGRSMMIVPDPETPEGEVRSPAFQVVFRRATVRTTAAPAPAAPVPPAAGVPSAPPSAPATDTGAAAAGAGGSDPSPSLGAGSTVAADPATPEATDPGVEAQAGGEPDDVAAPEVDLETPDLASGPVDGGGGAPQPWGRLVFLVPLSALGGLAAIVTRRVREGEPITLPALRRSASP